MSSFEIGQRVGDAKPREQEIVLAEIAEVLGQDRAAIEAEMRERYPAFEQLRAANRAGRSTDGPAVVATPVRPMPRGIRTR
jgi:hypothetical protein